MGCTMKTNLIKTYWEEEKTYEYHIIDGLKINIRVKDNSYNIPLKALFTMAARRNPKRSFLFVSKLLGKHIPISPRIGFMGNHLLARKYMEEVYGVKDEFTTEALVDGLINSTNYKELYEKIVESKYRLPEPVIFIGFAETATGLAQGIFNSFQGEGYYTHTTRDIILDHNFNIEFEEEHSHAKDHNCYGLREDRLKSDIPIVFIDDELTTGKTILNIIRALHSKYPRKSYTVLSLLDWRSREDIHRFNEIEKELGVSIKVISLVSGEIKVEGSPNMDLLKEHGKLEQSREETKVHIEYLMLDDYFHSPIMHKSLDGNDKEKTLPYLKETGRFGISTSDQRDAYNKLVKVGELLRSKRTSTKTLCLGTEEFIYIPMLIAANMGEGVRYHSTTRSPIYTVDREDYGARNGFSFESPSGSGAINYIYNIPYGSYDELFLMLEREVPLNQLDSIMNVLKRLGIPRITIVFCLKSDTKYFTGSYSEDDVVFLLKDISDTIEETDTEDKEEAIQSGIHYSEMLPVEYKPTKEYMDLFYRVLEESAEKVAMAVAIVSEKIIRRRGKNIVLVSLARAGTPVGILIKRYLKWKYGMKLPHYSVSIIRGKGIDENAIKYILSHYPGKEIQFIDGWTGKGAITKVLIESCNKMKESLGVDLNPDLAVLADPACCTGTFGTREDFLIPSACLNATVSGLISRTVHREDLIGENDFHGAKYYKEMEKEDVSNLFVDRITAEFPLIKEKIEEYLRLQKENSHEITWKGLEDIKKIQEDFEIDDINLIKPGIGETTRVLLRRVPWKILVQDMKDENLKHILLLAQDRNAPIEEYPHMTYGCCGLIKPLKE